MTGNAAQQRVNEGQRVVNGQAMELPSFETAISEEEPARALIHVGRGSDLVIVGQADPTRADAGRHAQAVAQLVQRNARPTLVLPCAGHFDRIGQSPIVAWDDSREAARAAADALPLLVRARSVQLLVAVARHSGGVAAILNEWLRGFKARCWRCAGRRRG